VIQKSLRLEYEPASERLHVSVKQFFVTASDDWAGGERASERASERERERGERETTGHVPFQRERDNRLRALRARDRQQVTSPSIKQLLRTSAGARNLVSLYIYVKQLPRTSAGGTWREARLRDSLSGQGQGGARNVLPLSVLSLSPLSLAALSLTHTPHSLASLFLASLARRASLHSQL